MTQTFRHEKTPPSHIRHNQTHHNPFLPPRRQKLPRFPLFFSGQEIRANFEREKITIDEQHQSNTGVNEWNHDLCCLAIEDTSTNNSQHNTHPNHWLRHFMRSGRGLGPVRRCSPEKSMNINDSHRTKPDDKSREKQK